MKTIYISESGFREKLIQSSLTIHLLIILLCFIFTSKASGNETYPIVSVTVTLSDKSNEESIPFANVVAYQNNVQVAVATTDMDGVCLLQIPSNDKYDFKAFYVGYKTMEIKGVQIFQDKANWLNIKLSAGVPMTLCCCTCYCFDGPEENWWPKLWSPYREMYATWKEKREHKKIISREKEMPDFTETIVFTDSSVTEKIILPVSVNNEVKLFPNPSTGVFWLKGANDLNLQLTNLEGKLLKTFSGANSFTEYHINDLPDGIYYVHYTQQGKNVTEKLILMAD